VEEKAHEETKERAEDEKAITLFFFLLSYFPVLRVTSLSMPSA
jgi:hypothetical protein